MLPLPVNVNFWPGAMVCCPADRFSTTLLAMSTTTAAQLTVWVTA